MICVEKDGEVFKRLEENMRGSNASLFNCDNMDFLENVGELESVSFFDFDAYSCPNLAKLTKIWRTLRFFQEFKELSH